MVLRLSRKKIVNWRMLISVLTLFSLSACSGGSGSSDSSAALGSGQDPDPVLVDYPLAYVKRDLLLDENGDLLTSSVRMATAFLPGAELLIRDRASPSAPETSLTSGIFPDDEDGNAPLYDVKDLAVSFDGSQMAFALRAPRDPNLDDDEQPTWNLWLYDRATGSVTRIIGSDNVAEEGDDIAPAFLPDGRIVFSSTRQRTAKAVLLDEGKPQFSALDEDRNAPALALHVVDADGSDLNQITFNQSSDIDPAVMSDGRIVYSRWDNVADIDRISLYVTNPDGTEAQVLYGVHSHDTGPNGENIEFVEPSELPDGRLLVMMRSAGAQSRMGALPVAIDTTNYVEHDVPTFENAGLLADAQEILVEGDLTLDESRPPLQGRYAKINALNDGTNRLVVAWSQCLLRDTTSDPEDPIILPCTSENLAEANNVEADPLYGVWMHNLDDETQQPIIVAEFGEVYSDVVVLEDRLSPPVILDKTAGIDLDADLVAQNVGVLHIRSVYDLDGVATADIAALSDPLQSAAADRPARFLRVIKAVSIPDDDLVDLNGRDFGRSQRQLMRETIGYAPIEPDGSVQLKIPANIAFQVEVLDSNGRRISARHENWLQLRPGEEMQCVGCHDADSQAPHGRLAAQSPSINSGAPTDGSPFPNTEPALFANSGETMAQVVARVNGTANPDVNITYTDVWTDPNLRAKDVDFSYSYTDLTTTAPTAPSCVSAWNSLCRILVNYEQHIHPLWSVDRQELDAGGALVVDNTCTSCHSGVDGASVAMVPNGQLDLSDGPSPDEADHFNSYRELLFPDNEVELVNGAVIDRLIPVTDNQGNPVFETDENGNLVLDAGGNPVPLTQTFEVDAALRVGGANLSVNFFSIFDLGGSHAGRLSAAELKLVSEWIDLGGQYYNNPFDVPQ